MLIKMWHEEACINANLKDTFLHVILIRENKW